MRIYYHSNAGLLQKVLFFLKISVLFLKEIERAF